MSLSHFTLCAAVVVYVSGSIAALPLPGRVLLDVVRGHHALPHVGDCLQHTGQEVVVLSADWLG